MKHNRFEHESDDPHSSHDDARSFRFGHRCGSHHFRGRESEFGERFRRGGRHFGGWGGRGFGDRIFDSGESALRHSAAHRRKAASRLRADESHRRPSQWRRFPKPRAHLPDPDTSQEMGYATVSTSEGNKKLYTITAEGRAKLEENKAAVDAVFERMDKAGAEFGAVARRRSCAPSKISGTRCD